jgi:hypothetical protein
MSQMREIAGNMSEMFTSRIHRNERWIMRLQNEADAIIHQFANAVKTCNTEEMQRLTTAYVGKAETMAKVALSVLEAKIKRSSLEQRKNT